MATGGLHFENEEHGSSLLLQLDRLRQESVLTDVVLCCRGARFPCHRSVLASSSPYFRAMFCGDFLESGQSAVRLRGVTPGVLRGILDYVYTGRLSVEARGVLPLMRAASMLQYAALFRACSAFLQRRLSPDNCLRMLRLAETLSCGQLRGRAREVALRSFSGLSSSPELARLSLAQLLGLLEEDDLRAEEEQVLETLLAWVRHDPSSRRPAVAQLFQRVRLRHIHPTYLFRFVANEPLIRWSGPCARLVDRARRLALSLAEDRTPPWAAPRRCGHLQALVLVGGRENGERTSREALAWEEGGRGWRRLAKLPLRLYRASSAALQGLLYVTGGLCTQGPRPHVSAAVYTLSLETNRWRAAQPMLEPRFAHRSVSHLHFILALGGLGADGKLTAAVERFDAMFERWERVAAMPEAVLHPAVAAADQRVYVFGGEDAGQTPVRFVQVYHLARNSWSKMENRTVKNVSAPAAVMDGRIYIMGGYTRRTIAYDTKSNRFIKCANLKERRMHHSASVLNKRIYVSGGRHLDAHGRVQDSDALDSYDPETDAWSSEGTLPFKVFDHGSLSVPCASQTWAHSRP